MRIWLGKDGEVRVPTPAEFSHYGVAKTVLGPSWSGDTDDAYIDMWRAGWVRVRTDNHDKTVYGEKYMDGKRVPFADLSRPQRQWFEDRILEGDTLNWNSVVFEASRETAKTIANLLLDDLRNSRL